MKNSIKTTTSSILLVCAIMATGLTSAFSESIKLGKVSPSDFIQAPYEKDPDASAVILYDYGETYYDYNSVRGFEYVFKRVLRLQILDEKGLDWADFGFRLYGSGRDGDRDSRFDAYVHNLEDGKVNSTRMRRRDLLEEQTTDWFRTIKVSFQGAKVGSILEVTYTINSPFFTSPPAWQFQYSIPVIYSEYNFSQPDFFHFNTFMQGYIALSSHTRVPRNQSWNIIGRGGSGAYRFTTEENKWVLKDVPAMRNEPFTTNIANYYSIMHFELGSIQFQGERPSNYVMSWNDVDKQLRESESFGDYLSGTRRFRSAMSGLAGDSASEMEKIESVLYWFKNNITWDNSTGVRTSNSANQVITKGSGSVSEINLLLVAALRELGLNANPIISSTQANGIVLQAFPTIRRFNYVLAGVTLDDNSLLLLDATEPLTPIGMLPLRAINFTGRMIGDKTASWVDLKVDTPRQERFEIEATIDAEGKMEGSFNINSGGYDAYARRRAIKNHANLEEYCETIQKAYSNLEFDELEVVNPDDISENIIITANFVSTDGVQVAGDLMFFTPLIVEATKENPFTLEERKYPVDFTTPIQESLSFIYEIPEGYEVDFLPRNASIRLGRFANYTFGIKHEDNKIEVSSFLNIRKSFYTADEYQHLKEFFDKVVEKQAEQIVLKQK